MRPCCARFAFSFFPPSNIPRIVNTTNTARSNLSRRPVVAQTMSKYTRQYASIPKEQPGDEADDVLFSSLYGVRTVELNRPKKLNSLNGSMARKILPRLKEWEKSQMANVILMTGAGPKALCAGGDVAALALQNKKGSEGQKESTDYFGLEYQLDYTIATYSKPYIAIMDGITMGGGVGLSVHAPFRIATEKTVFAMPETTIGFFPDVGAGFFLPRLDGEIGTYLALTSERLLGVQALYAGIATHYVDSSVLGQMTTRLSELTFKDYAKLPERLQLINATLKEFTSDLPSPDSYEKAPYGNLTGSLRSAVDRCFSYDSVEEILEALKREQESNSESRLQEWAASTAKTIAQRSPTSCKVALRQIRLGERWSISEAFVKEHMMAAHFMAHHDFVEGVSARLINKPPTDPRWQPKSLKDVSPEDVEAYFGPLDGVEELKLVEPSQGGPNPDYTDYPHASFALPREADIEQAITDVGERNVLAEIRKRWNNKEGVQEKVKDFVQRRRDSSSASRL